MKKFSFNIGVIFISFAIGLAINSACADSLGDGMSSVEKMDLSELKELVSTLQGKVTTLENNLNKANNSISNLTAELNSLQTKNDALTQRVASLEQNGSSDSSNDGANSSVCGLFQVDGLWFSPTGYVQSKPISSTSHIRTIYNSGEVQEYPTLNTVYHYDAFGRVIKITYSNLSQQYSYKENMVILTTEVIADTYRSVTTTETTYSNN